MTTRGRKRWLLAALAMTVFAGELAAFQLAAPRAKALMTGDRAPALLRAGAIVGRDLAAHAGSAVSGAAAAVAIHMVRETSQLYRLALAAMPATGIADCAIGSSAKRAAARCAARARRNHEAGGAFAVPACLTGMRRVRVLVRS